MLDFGPLGRGLLASAALATLAACGTSAGAEPLADDGAEGVDPPDPSGSGTGTPPAVTPPPSTPTPLGPIGEWTWLDVPGAECGLGQPTGFAVNVGTGSDILVYLEGGGLCWDEQSCSFEIPGKVALASYFLTGYGEQTFESNTPRTGIFDRARADNPFRTSTIVYVPYCTGDFHAGSAMQDLPSGKVAHFSGRQNLDLYLAKITTALPGASRVTLAGTSAGGFGALINFGHVRDVFGKLRVDLIADSAPALWMQSPIMSGLWAWNLGKALPAGCPDCARDLRGLYTYYATTYPDARLAFTSFDRDRDMALGGYFLLPDPLFSNEIDRFTKATLNPLPNFKYFVPTGEAHGMLANLDVVSQPRRCHRFFGMCLFPQDVGEPQTLGSWLMRMVSDDPSWSSISAIAQ